MEADSIGEMNGNSYLLSMPRLTYLFVTAALFMLIAMNGVAQTRSTDSLTVERALTYYRLSSPVLSPDGNKCALVVSQPATPGKPGANHIWLVDLRDSSTRQYTASDKSESNPKWAPKGKKLAFLSNRGGENQVYLLDDNGGEALPLTSSKTGVRDYEWSPDGKSIAYIESDSVTAAEKKRKDDKYDETVMSKNGKASILFIIDLATKAAHRQPGRNWEIANLKYLPSGDALVLEVEELPAKEIPAPRLVKLDIANGSYSDIASPRHPSWGNIEIAPGGKLFCFTGARTDGPVAHDLFVQGFGESEARNITGKSIDLPVRGIKFVGDDLLAGIVQHGMNFSLYKISVTGKASDWKIGKNVSAYDLSADNKVVFVSATASSLQELWLYTDGQKAVQLTHFNKTFDKISFVTPEVVSYKSFDGTPIEALLLKPAREEAGDAQRKSSVGLPMVVIIHGGPTGAFSDSYNEWAQLFVQKGYAVMMPNIRGSTGYGWKFLEANRRDWGGGDFKDVMAGVDYMIAHKGIDSGRLAIVGWSYGGYMSEWAITQTHRFKAAMSGAGLFNLASEFGTENGASYDNWHLGTPYENMEVFARHSAISFIKNAQTPTLIIQGREDDTDPIGQSQELYRALRYYNVPAELVLYPNERHGFVDLKHKMDYISRMLDWVEKYVPLQK
jgi:dipeptidyl aminopeptidase/acylaminoacyl peptidase